MMIEHIENIEEMELNIQTTEGTDLNYSFAGEDLPSFVKTKERMKTIKDLITQSNINLLIKLSNHIWTKYIKLFNLGGEKYKEFENQIDPERHNLEK